MSCFEKPGSNIKIDDLIASAQECIDKYCNSDKERQKNGWTAFGTGLGAMFGLSGIKGLGPPGEDASSLLNFVKQYGEDLQVQNTMNFATNTIDIEEKFLTDLKKHNLDINLHLQGLEQIINANFELEQIEIFGAYILIFLILFFILIN